MKTYIDDIRKLMDARDKAVNPNEAAAAAGIIARLCAKHNISEEEIIGRNFEIGEGDKVGHDKMELGTNKRITKWHVKLASGVARATFTRVVFSLRSSPPYFNIFGRKKNMETFSYMFQYLMRTIKEIAEKGQAVDRALDIPKGKSWWNTWYHGCVETVTQRLQESLNETIQEMAQGIKSRELVVVNKFALLRKEADMEIKKLFPRLMSMNTGYRSNQSAYESGKAAGSRISLPGKGISGGGTPRGLIG